VAARALPRAATDRRALDGTANVLRDGLRDALEDFLREANGQPFCDGCLSVELRVGRLDVQHALDGDLASMDRGHGRCSVCGQTLMVTRTPTP
jgi:hypothetical protein